MEREVRFVASALILVAGAILFGAGIIAQADRSVYFLELIALAGGAILILMGIVRMFRSRTPDALREAIKEKFNHES